MSENRKDGGGNGGNSLLQLDVVSGVNFSIAGIEAETVCLAINLREKDEGPALFLTAHEALELGSLLTLSGLKAQRKEVR